MATAQLPDGFPQQTHAVVFALYPGDPNFYTVVERAPEVGGAPGTATVVAWLEPGIRHYVEYRNATVTFSYYRFRHAGFTYDFGEPTAWYRARPEEFTGEIPYPPREALLDMSLVLDESDGTVNIVVNGSRRVASISWDWSLVDFPTSATTSVDTDAEGDVTVTDAFTLQPGDTGFVRVDFYDQPSSGGNLLGTLRASVQFLSGSNPSGGGFIILNHDFDEGDPGEGAYWATATGSTGVANSQTPTVGAGVDFEFSADDQTLTIVQVTDDDDDITKSITV